MAEEPRRATWFAPVVLLGLSGSVLLAVTAARDWIVIRPQAPEGGGISTAFGDLGADMPLALALALVVLAGWGVVLVTRARIRRAMLGLAGLATLGVVVCLVRAPFTLPDQIRSGATFDGPSHADPTAAYVIAGVAVLVTLLAILAGWVLAPRWPEMSSRYDAPTAASAPTGTDDLSLWKALDEGHDPTTPPSA